MITMKSPGKHVGRTCCRVGSAAPSATLTLTPLEELLGAADTRGGESFGAQINGIRCNYANAWGAAGVNEVSVAPTPSSRWAGSTDT